MGCVCWGGHVKTSKLRKQSPYPYILIDHLCLDLDSLKRARLPCQIKSTDAFEGNRWKQYNY